MIIGIIPARYASTRFPGKPLIDIQGKSMIQRVYEQASQAKCLSEVIVATDDERILNHVQSFGGKAVMTHPDHPSGTDRCWEAYCLGVRSQERSAARSEVRSENKLTPHRSGGRSSLLAAAAAAPHSYIINIQGDEPFVAPEQIDELGAVLDGNVELASQMIPVSDHEVLFDTGEAKVIVNQEFEAIYFSRQVLPFLKGIDPKEWHKHHTYYRQVGMYAYRSDILEKITKLPVSDLEKAESLEQLRWIQNGYKIKMGLTAYESHCIDTPEDVEKVLRLMNA